MLRTSRSVLSFGVAWAVLTMALVLAVGWDLVPHLPELVAAPDAGARIDRAGVVLNDLSRVAGVTLSMLAVLCALAIPLTANVYTPKLIELFLADRWNRYFLSFLVFVNAVVLWNKVVISTLAPDSVHPRVLFCFVLVLTAVLSIAPYFDYVLRFLVPRSILRRLQGEIEEGLRDALRAPNAEVLQETLRGMVDNIHYIGNITLRSVERYDRDTADAGLQTLREVFFHYQTRKARVPRPPELRTSELLCLSPELGLEVERRRSTLEVAVLQELTLILPVAMQRLPQTVAQLAALTRKFGVRTAERDDRDAREMVTLHFNTFLRRTLKERDPESFYRFVYQYRRFAEDLLELDAAHARQVAFFLDYYGHQAVKMGLTYLINVVAYDLAALSETAFSQRSPLAKHIMGIFLELDRDDPELIAMPGIVKAQIILAAKLRAQDEARAASCVVLELKKVPTAALAEAFSQIVAAREENFWEIADRRRHLDHVEPRYRRAIDQLRREFLGERRAGEDTLLFLGEAGKARPTRRPPRLADLERTLPPRVGEEGTTQRFEVEVPAAESDSVSVSDSDAVSISDSDATSVSDSDATSVSDSDAVSDSVSGSHEHGSETERPRPAAADA